MAEKQTHSVSADSGNLQEEPIADKESHSALDRKIRALKAVKSDDAEIPEFIWYEKINMDRKNNPIPSHILNKLRGVCLKWWKKQVTKSFWKWLQKRPCWSTSIDLEEWKDSGVRATYINGKVTYEWSNKQNYKASVSRVWDVMGKHMVAAREWDVWCVVC